MTGEASGNGIALDAARAIDAFRRGWVVAVTDGTDTIKVRALETLSAPDLPAREGVALLISPGRAATLKLVNQLNAADIATPVMIALPDPASAAALLAIADPVLDLDQPMKGPFRTLAVDAPGAAIAAIELTRLAGLLPACLVLRHQTAVAQTVGATSIAAFADAEQLIIAARARLPVAAAQNAEIVAFRSVADATEHVALVIGRPRDTPPLVRVHSECLTGDVFGSLKCDCGPQLAKAIEAMAATGAGASGWGILLYLRQEGRGIGLINKLRAYMLQDQGFDTVDANVRLGFASDTRDFSVAARMLRLLSVQSVRLLTNNPDKVSGLTAAGINVVERVPHLIAGNTHNQRYLDTKRDRSGHQL